jgi:cell division protein FtsB
MIALVALALLAGVFLIFLPQWRRTEELTARLEEEKAKLAAEELQRDKRLREVDLLENDPAYVETIARDKIDVMREGEVVIRLDPAVGGDPAIRALPPAER